MLHFHINTLCLVHWPWNSLTSGALFKVILTMTESLCKTRRSRLIGSHFTCITSTSVIVLIFQLKKSSQWHISVRLLFRMRKSNSVFPFFSLINKITTSISQWVTPSRTRGVSRDRHWGLNIGQGNWSIALKDSEWASGAGNCSVRPDQTFPLFPLLPSCVRLALEIMRFTLNNRIYW